MYEEKVRKFKCYYCPDCKLYAGSETKIVHGRRMKPNTKYCTGGKKITIFRSDDPKVNVPKWCPKRRVPPTLRIYHFRSPEIEAGESMLAANGISFFPYPSRYAVRYEGESPYTAMDFARQIKKRPLAELLSMQLLPYEILEIDDGIRPYCFLVERLGHVRCIRFKMHLLSLKIGIIQPHLVRHRNFNSLTIRIYANHSVHLAVHLAKWLVHFRKTNDTLL